MSFLTIPPHLQLISSPPWRLSVRSIASCFFSVTASTVSDWLRLVVATSYLLSFEIRFSSKSYQVILTYISFYQSQTELFILDVGCHLFVKPWYNWLCVLGPDQICRINFRFGTFSSTFVTWCYTGSLPILPGSLAVSYGARCRILRR